MTQDPGASDTWSFGPSLIVANFRSNGMRSLVTLLMRFTSAVTAWALLLPAVAQDQAARPAQPDVSAFLQNYGGPLVTSEFAATLGVLVIEQKYPGVGIEPVSPTVLDKGDAWSVTFTISQWPKDMEKLRPLLPHRITLLIRKSDAAVLGIR